MKVEMEAFKADVQDKALEFIQVLHVTIVTVRELHHACGWRCNSDSNSCLTNFFSRCPTSHLLFGVTKTSHV